MLRRQNRDEAPQQQGVILEAEENPGEAMKHPARKSIGFQLMLAARLYRTRMALLLDEIGLFPGQEQTLQILATQNGATMGELARVLRVRPPTISKTIARLTQQGLVERHSSEQDGRVVRVHLTAAGLARLDDVERAAEAIEAEILEFLEEKDAKRLRKTLRRVARGLNLIVDPDNSAELERDLAQEEIVLSGDKSDEAR